jgi:hypothetical protein
VLAPWPGRGLALFGLLLLAAGGWQLIREGRGLPMNAFPPSQLVRSGIFRWIRNPMYLGFGLAAAGVAIATGSAAGLWLVTPVLWLSSAALVFGYERHDLIRRFGVPAGEPPLLSLPQGENTPPTGAHRVAVYLWVLLPWLIAYFAVQALGRAPDAFGLITSWERDWPVLQWTELLYVSAYLFIPLTPLVMATRSELRRFAFVGAVATGIVTLLWLVIPVVATNREFIPTTALGRLLAFEQNTSQGVAAFPAFHVLWALIAGAAWIRSARATERPLLGWIGGVWAGLVVLASLTTGHHTLPEAAAAVLLFLPLARPERTWARIREGTERVANSWREWRFGPVRVINHGFWAGLGAGLGLVIAGGAVGEAHFWVAAWIGLCVLLGAGLWAQWLEGSSRLLRPFGWYGGLLGGALGAVSAHLVAAAPLVHLLAGFALAAPWIQISGRIRCLVQGCCHGGPTASDLGIRYRHPRSRVTALAGLAGTPIHPTPLYSIASNLVVATILLRLWWLGANEGLVLGLFFILTGLARFVEESYRGEPQTPIVGGLRLYQWFAILSVLIGIGCTLLPSAPASGGLPWPSLPLVGAALGLAFLATFAMGVDFPNSNRRYSRLADAG